MIRTINLIESGAFRPMDASKTWWPLMFSYSWSFVVEFSICSRNTGSARHPILEKAYMFDTAFALLNNDQ
jgi:hypothetical protein